MYPTSSNMSKCFPLIIIIVAISSLSLLPITNSISFKITHFKPKSSKIQYQGDAVYSNGNVEFNKVDYNARVGIITYRDKVQLWDKDSGNISDFSTHFTFVIDTMKQQSNEYGHGLTFFIAPVGFQIPPNSYGGFLGLFNTTTSDSPSNQMIVVEFDSFVNPEWDPGFEHVGINIDSIASTVQTRWNASEHSGSTADVWIVYSATTKNLSVSWSYMDETKQSSATENMTLSLQIDPMKVIPEWVNIGFSGATGKYYERHILKSWEFSSNLEVPPDDKKPSDHSRLPKKILILVASGASIFVLGAIIALAFLYQRRKAKLKNAEETLFNDELERGAGPRRFSYLELDSATHHFSYARKLGEGGFGGVYKGYLIDSDMPIAVKKFSKGSKQGKKEYVTEVKTISTLRHRNLVQLIGWCHEKDEFLLVYEYMPNGSLDGHLFGEKDPLSWPMRYNIAFGLASGLYYLHEEWEQCVVHRDIKPSNIMLDSNYNVKLGDFGLATVMEHGIGAQTITLAGTLGYMAPEYMSTRKASKESDVYSFGVVLLEIATGRKTMDPVANNVRCHQKGLVQWVWDLYGDGNLLSAVDEKLHHMGYEAKQVECLMILGLWCVYPDYNHRPSIKQAIQVLNFETTLPTLPPQMPVPIYEVPMPLPSDTSSGPPMLTTSLDVGC